MKINDTYLNLYNKKTALRVAKELQSKSSGTFPLPDTAQSYL